MNTFFPWSSKNLSIWRKKFARGKIIVLEGKETHFVEMGNGDPIILLHGFYYDSHLWDSNIDILAKHYKVYAIDHWGFGYNTRENLEFGYPLFAKQSLLFMDHLKIKKAILIGQSMGGGTII